MLVDNIQQQKFLISSFNNAITVCKNKNIVQDEDMKKKDYIYCSIILLILFGSFFTIDYLMETQDENCFNILKEIANSPDEI